MGRDYYIASCVFTARHPELSSAIRRHVGGTLGLPVVRCCVPRYKFRSFTDKMPEGALREEWQALPDCAGFQPGDTTTEDPQPPREDPPVELPEDMPLF